MKKRASLHPPLEPYRRDWLSVSHDHRLYYEESGNPRGLPVVCLHGGPGSGSSPDTRRFFDPARYRIIQYDQRGSGGSEPHGALRGNATHHLLEDLEALREHLGVEHWRVFGGSWGATLALAYAQDHPERVLGLILRGPLLGRRRDLDWFFGPDGVARIFPLDYQRFLEPLPEPARAAPLQGYRELLLSEDQEIREHAARAWAAWDHRVATGQQRDAGTRADTGRYAIACHYAVNGFFLPDDGVLRGMDRIAEIPGVVVQGQYDLVCPAEGAAALAERWRRGELRIVGGAGHLVQDPGIERALLAAVRDWDLP